MDIKRKILEGFLQGSYVNFYIKKDNIGCYEKNEIRSGWEEAGGPVGKLQQWSRQEKILNWTRMRNGKDWIRIMSPNQQELLTDWM